MAGFPAVSQEAVTGLPTASSSALLLPPSAGAVQAGPMQMVPQMIVPCVPLFGSMPAVSPVPPPVFTDQRIHMAKHILQSLRKGRIGEEYDTYFAEDAIISTPTLSDRSPVPFSGAFKGRSAAETFGALYNSAFSTDTSVELRDPACAGNTVYGLLEIKGHVASSGHPYEANELLVFTFLGGKVRKLQFYVPAPIAEEAFLVQHEQPQPVISPRRRRASQSSHISDASVPPPLLTSEEPSPVVRQRRVADKRPCAHNQWDNVRIKKGEIMLRCRLCQEQWRTPANSPRCPNFQNGTCTEGDSCRLLHIHAHKQSLADRHQLFGPIVLEHVPLRQRASVSTSLS